MELGNFLILKLGSGAPFLQKPGSFGIQSSNVQRMRLAHLESNKSRIRVLKSGEFILQTSEAEQLRASMDLGLRSSLPDWQVEGILLRDQMYHRSTCCSSHPLIYQSNIHARDDFIYGCRYYVLVTVTRVQRNGSIISNDCGLYLIAYRTSESL